MNNDQNDEIEFSEDDDDFVLSNTEARQLYDFLEHEYISFEFYPLLPSMIRRLSTHVK